MGLQYSTVVCSLLKDHFEHRTFLPGSTGLVNQPPWRYRIKCFFGKKFDTGFLHAQSINWTTVIYIYPGNNGNNRFSFLIIIRSIASQETCHATAWHNKICSSYSKCWHTSNGENSHRSLDFTPLDNQWSYACHCHATAWHNKICSRLEIFHLILNIQRDIEVHRNNCYEICANRYYI